MTEMNSGLQLGATNDYSSLTRPNDVNSTLASSERLQSLYLVRLAIDTCSYFTTNTLTQDIIRQIGMLLRFQADVTNLGVQGYVPNPPSNLVENLKADCETFNQTCDGIELIIVGYVSNRK